MIGVSSHLCPLCSECGAEISHDSVSPMCLECRVDQRLALEAERALDFQALSREALVTRVVTSAKARAAALHPTTYRSAAPLVVT